MPVSALAYFRGYMMRPYHQGMNIGGNTKQKFCFWAATAFFVIAALCAIQSSTGGGDLLKGITLAGLMLGFVCLVGVWSTGLAKDEDPDEAEFSQNIK